MSCDAVDVRMLVTRCLKVAILATILTAFVFRFVSSWEWTFRKLRGRVFSNESIWVKTKHGDLAAYGDFLKRELFKKDYPYHSLLIPNYKRSNARFVCKLWPPIPSMYLFPIEVVVSERYNLNISRQTYLELMELPLVRRVYKDRVFYIVDGLRVDELKEWAVYVLDGPRYVHIFTLPEGYMGLGAMKQ